jgi:Bacterial dnaA protein helix-turn-helix
MIETIAPLAVAEGILFRAGKITRYYPDQIRKRTRVQEMVRIRQAIIYVVHKRTNLSFPRIARFVGLTDHSTAIYAVGVVDNLKGRDEALAHFIDDLMTAPPVTISSTTARLALAGVVPQMAPEPREILEKQRARRANAKLKRAA